MKSKNKHKYSNDQICEMRLYIPNKEEEGNEKEEKSEENEEYESLKHTAELIKDEIVKYANIRTVGDSIAHFPEISMLSPR